MTGDRVQVVVTGLGAVTPLGHDTATTWNALLAGTSGIQYNAEDWARELPVQITAPAAVEPRTLIPPAQLRIMDRCQQFALLASREAWKDAGEPEVAPERLGVCVSSSLGGIQTTIEAHDLFREKGWKRLSSFLGPMNMPAGSAAWIAIELGARAGTHSPVSACASGTEAIGYGIDMIRSGRADVVVAGGTDAPLNNLTIACFAAMRALSTRNDEPARACRPFDKGRDGIVLGEGAGIVVLESAEHAVRRGAAIHAVAAGVGYGGDTFHVAQPDPEGTGSALSLQNALADAQIRPEQVVHLNAHATSTPNGDRSEALAIRRVFGEAAANVVVSATKSMTGHLLAGAGAVETIATIRALATGVAPPTVNLDEPEDEIAAHLDIAVEPRELVLSADRNAVVNNSSGFGGHNATLVFTPARWNPVRP